jgi:exodeoxyribonuclease VII large subunit
MREDAIFFEVPGRAPHSPAQPHLRVWPVGALVHAVADVLDSRFNPVAVRGEITGFSRAASGHCYFSLKDDTGQIRCAMFRRAAMGLAFTPKEGDLVELRGKLAVYEPRGDLQLIVEHMERAGQGAWFEQFLKLKVQLEAEGLFDAQRKREVTLAPRGIGLVTSLGAAALQDVSTALARRVPHIPVWLSPASVQGTSAPAELCAALQKLYQRIEETRQLVADVPSQASSHVPQIDVILLVRGGGSAEDLAAFNDESLARTIAQSPVPVICGVGHETDFSIADFVSDLRAPTPTAAAELCAADRQTWLGAVGLLQGRLQEAAQQALDRAEQELDQAAAVLARPSEAINAQRLALQRREFALKRAMLSKVEQTIEYIRRREPVLPQIMQFQQLQRRQKISQVAQALEHLNPQGVLARGYAVLQADAGVVTQARQVKPGDLLKARVAQGEIALTVT